MNELHLLDCTLRDGGYVNDWKFGLSATRDIIRSLVRAGTDIVEVGFLNTSVSHTPGVTRWPLMEDLKEVLPADRGSTLFSAMAIHNFYDTDLLPAYDGTGVDMLRITFHDYDVDAGLAFCRRAKEKGYKLSCNPINIMGYNDSGVLRILDAVNELQPYAFSIVDTHGSMNRKDLDRLVSLADHNLDPAIRLGLHLHENMAQSYALAQQFVEKNLHRGVILDGSLMGMGRIPGNLPIELLAHYLNENWDKQYDINCLLDAIEDHIAPLKGHPAWGYTPVYFLSAKYNLHRTYAEHFSGKGDLTHRDINRLLARIAPEKKTAFDAAYADSLYTEYQTNQVDDTAAKAALAEAVSGKTVLVLAPGASLASHAEEICRVIEAEKPLVISANFIPDDFTPDFAFFTNNKRFDKLENAPCPLIVTSNLPEGGAAYRVDYNRLRGSFAQGGNSVVLLLQLLAELSAGRVLLAGADGYRPGQENYLDGALHSHTARDRAYNRAVAAAIRGCGLPVTYLTPSEYEAEV